LRRELAQKSIINDILNKNLSKVIGANEIIIKVNPVDHELLEKSSKEYLVSNSISKISFEKSEYIEIGGCLIETEIGNLDARIETQINEILKALEDKLAISELE